MGKQSTDSTVAPRVALYRKYRPRSLDGIIGQSHITSVLQQSIDKKQISHAYLLTGPRGVGKTSIARVLAHSFNGLEYSEQPHMDIIEIDAASNRRIDDIRELREKVAIAPSSAAYKVYIIDEVHMLTGESFNALLKTLEEPPSHVVFILATTELHKIPATILSRTQRFQFRSVPTDEIVSHLKTIATNEHIQITDDALQLIAEKGDGSFRDSISLLDQLSHHDGQLDAYSATQILGIAPNELIESIAQAIITKDNKSLSTAIESIQQRVVSAKEISNQLAEVMVTRHTERMDSALLSLVNDLIEVPRSYNPETKLILLLLTRKSQAAVKQPAKSMPLAAAEKTDSKLLNPVIEDAPAPAKTVKATADIKVTRSAPSPSNGAFNWNELLEYCHKRSAPLHSVLKRAEYTYEDNTLTLSFGFALHRKKMDDPKYRLQLGGMIDGLFGFVPELVIAGQSVQASPIIDAVSDIMGGGEIVNARI